MLISVDGDLFKFKVGVVLVIVDKVDFIMSFFVVGLIFSGFNDLFVLCC